MLGLQSDHSFLILGPDVRPHFLPPPFFTQAQVKVSETMAHHVRQHKTDFVVNVGDNFYLCGVPNLEHIRFEVTLALIIFIPIA